MVKVVAAPMNVSLRHIAKSVVHKGLPLPGPLRPLIRGAYRAGVFAVESLAFVRKVLWIEPVLRSVCTRVGRGLRAECLPYMRGEGRLELGDFVRLSGRSCFYFIHGMPAKPSITVGDHTFIGNGSTLSAAREIRIGAHCLLSALVRVHDNDGHPLDPERRRRHEPIRADEAAPVIIEDNVWIGAGATILKGVRIGQDAVVGTGAVVTTDVPAGAIVAGNPARVVKQLESGA
ncbi:MAG: acyltransferase [Lentisphaerae bacterium]|nr:acyltransferase [Lentisphaerota bacterium]